MVKYCTVTKESHEANQAVGRQVRMSQVRLQVDAESADTSEAVREVFKSEVGEQGEEESGGEVITMFNGVVVFEKFTEWENTDTSKMKGVVVYIGQEVWAVERPANEYDSKLTVRCDSKQDAIDIAAMFAARASHKDCDNCENNERLDTDEPCDSCLPSSRSSRKSTKTTR